MSFLTNSGFWAGVAAWSGAVAAAATIWALILSSRESTAKDRELDEFKTQAREDIAVANAQAAGAQLEQERLKATIAWREMTPEQTAKLREVISGHENGLLLLEIISNDPEAMAFAEQIRNTFVRSGWKVGRMSQTFSRRVVTGLYLPSGDGPEKVLREAFTAAGVEFTTEPKPRPDELSQGWGDGLSEMHSSTPTILVASKPRRF